MTNRDRMVIIALAVLALLAAGWILVVSPERQQASKLATQVSAANAEKASAEGKLASARSAQSQYAADYSSIVSLGKAVPPTQEVPSLIFQLAAATGQKDVEFNSITSGGGTSASPSPSASATPSGGAAAAATFTEMPFTFIFNGSFFDLEHLFHQLDSFANITPTGTVQVSGRLLTIQSIKLAPLAAEGTSGGATSELSGTITATAYELPAGQSLTGGATATTPAGSASSTSSTASPSSTTAPAIARVTP